MGRMTRFLSEQVGLETWVATVLGILLATFVAHQLAALILRRAQRAAERTAIVWDDAVVRSTGKPLRIAIWVVGFGFVAKVLQGRVDTRFIEDVTELRNAAIIACVAWFALRFVQQVGHNLVALKTERGEEFDRTTVDALGKLGRLTILVVAVLMIAQTLGFQITGLLALGGVGGIAVGFAAKDLLANFFGGLTIYLDRPFSVGDWIRSPDKSIEGTVEYISWRHTRIRAFNKNPVYVPNSIFTTIVVENPSRMSHRRIKETIGVRYEDFDAVATIVDDIKAMLRSHPGIDATQTLIVNFNQFGPSSLNILIYTFTRTVVWIEYHEVKQDVLLKIGGIIAQRGAEIAFPTQTLHLQHAGMQDTAPTPARD